MNIERKGWKIAFTATLLSALIATVTATTTPIVEGNGSTLPLDATSVIKAAILILSGLGLMGAGILLIYESMKIGESFPSTEPQRLRIVTLKALGLLFGLMLAIVVFGLGAVIIAYTLLGWI